MATRIRVLSKRPILVEGKTVKQGEIAMMPDRDVKKFVAAELIEIVVDGEETSIDVSETPAKEWKLKLSPKEYLEKFPSGPHAELALSIVALADEESE